MLCSAWYLTYSAYTLVVDCKAEQGILSEDLPITLFKVWAWIIEFVFISIVK